MQKSSLPVGVKTLFKYYEAKTLDFDNPVQRHAGQWNNLQQSMLIHSILGDYIIPNLYFKKEAKEGTNYLSVLDGLQRLSTVFSFIRDEWVTHAKTPKVSIDGIEYDISLKKFSELEDDIKSAILGYRFTTYQLENCTDEEIEETFTRLNSGTPLSKIQQARPKMGIELADWCNQLVAKDFFQKSANLTVSQLRREDDLLMLITGMMLLDSRYEGGFKIKTSASAAECVRFAESIKNNYPQEKREDMELLVEYLSDAFGGAEYKFLKKNNIPIIIYVAQIAIEHGITENEFLNTVVEFFENDCTEAYKEASGSGNVKMVNVSIRLNELLSYMMYCLPKYFEKDGDLLADFIEEADKVDNDSPVEESDAPSTAGNESDPEEPMENSDENSEDSSDDENTEEDSEESSSDAESGEDSENIEDSSSEDDAGIDEESSDGVSNERNSDTGEQMTE